MGQYRSVLSQRGEGYLVHHRTGNLNPGQAGTDAQRFFELTDTVLTLRPPPRMIDGREVQSALTWERLNQPASRGHIPYEYRVSLEIRAGDLPGDLPGALSSAPNLRRAAKAIDEEN